VILGHQARNAGYEGGWEHISWPSRVVWRQWARTENQLNAARRVWTRVTLARHSPL
jgi:hypothetical protein